MTTIIRGEGIAHTAAFHAAGIQVLPFMNLTEVTPPYLGAFAPQAWADPRAVANAIAAVWAPLPLAQRFLDAGGWPFMRCLAPWVQTKDRDCTPANIVKGLDQGYWIATSEVYRWAGVAYWLREEHGMEPSRVLMDMETYPRQESAQYAGIVQPYMQQHGLTAPQMTYLSQYANIYSAQQLMHCVGWPNALPVIEMHAKTATWDSAVLPVRCPVSHIAMGLLSGDFPTWWGKIEAQLKDLRRQNCIIWTTLAGDMPPAQAAIGMALNRKYGVECCHIFAANTTDEATMAPQIAAMAQAIGTVSAIPV